jgi:hypothetical protein
MTLAQPHSHSKTISAPVVLSVKAEEDTLIPSKSPEAPLTTSTTTRLFTFAVAKSLPKWALRGEEGIRLLAFTVRIAPTPKFLIIPIA